MSQLQPPSLSTDHSFGENTVCRRYGFANRTANGLIRAEENSFGLMSEVESQDGLSFPVEIIEFGSHRRIPAWPLLASKDLSSLGSSVRGNVS